MRKNLNIRMQYFFPCLEFTRSPVGILVLANRKKFPHWDSNPGRSGESRVS